MSTCDDCVHCKEKAAGEGKCKKTAIKRHYTYGDGGEKVHNGWPKVTLTDEACGDCELS